MTKAIRQIRLEGNIAYVPLTQGYEAVIDASDVALVEGVNWCAKVCPHAVYAMRRTAGPRPKTVYLHRVLVGGPDGLEVDHEDGDGLNNRRSNLRLATRSANQCNSRKRSGKVSRFKGVTWEKSAGKWRAQITLNYSKQHLGLFNSEDDAADAYARASASIHGEFGRLA